jgi:hypothetical protein
MKHTLDKTSRPPATVRRYRAVIVGFLYIASAIETRADGLALEVRSLVSACTKADPEWISFCNGYIQAAVDLVELNQLKVCFPAGVTRNDIFDKVLLVIASQQYPVGQNALAVLASTVADIYKCN